MVVIMSPHKIKSIYDANDHYIKAIKMKYSGNFQYFG
mgnify:CR=1 FL=1